MSQNFRIKNRNGNDYITVESDRIEACLDYYRANDLYGIAISPYHGYKEPNVDFLGEVPGLKGLIVNDEITELDVINSLQFLEVLSIGKPKKVIYLDKLANLKKFTGNWTPKVASLAGSSSIKDLALWGFKSKTKNLLELSGLQQLERLQVVSSQVESLEGIEQLTNVATLELRYLSKLTEIGAISALSEKLTHLEFENCKNINSYAALAGCTALNRLTIEKSAAIRSFAFTEPLKSLKKICWTKTRLECEPAPVVEAEHIEKVIGSNGRFIKGSN